MLHTIKTKEDPSKTVSPKIAYNVFLADSADIIGDVIVGKNSSIWHGCVVRGDVMPIIIGEDTNIQDNSCLHGTLNKAALVIGNEVSVGHGCILHGCQIEDRCLIGMGSIVMDNAIVPKNCIVGAGSLVTENATFEEGSLIIGRPAKVKRKLNEDELNFLKKSADNYIAYKEWYS